MLSDWWSNTNVFMIQRMLLTATYWSFVCLSVCASGDLKSRTSIDGLQCIWELQRGTSTHCVPVRVCLHTNMYVWVFVLK